MKKKTIIAGAALLGTVVTVTGISHEVEAEEVLKPVVENSVSTKEQLESDIAKK